MTTPTTTQRLQEKYWAALATALPDRVEEQRAVDSALDTAELDVVPRVWGDERRWRLAVDAVDEPRVIDSEDLARELAQALIDHPDATVIVRPADDDEAHAHDLLGADGLRTLDEQRRQEDAAMAEETAAALIAALGDPAAVPEQGGGEERCPCHGWRKVKDGEASRDDAHRAG
ncbi:hypothetical protein [Microtetraspora malaysiensis]|uniref:hypothetical protein n=1 Tax=Microtetraspora malaysiensis TaxID=161358 RepID=UPI003D8EC16A